MQRFAAPDGRPPGLNASIDAAGTRLAEVWGLKRNEGSLLEVMDLASGKSLWTHDFSAHGAVDRPSFLQPRWVAGRHEPAVDLGRRRTPPRPASSASSYSTRLRASRWIGSTWARAERRSRGCRRRDTWSSGLPSGAPDCYGGNERPHAFALVDPASGTSRSLVDDDIGDAMVSSDGRVLVYTTKDDFVVAVDLQTGKRRARAPLQTTLQRDGNVTCPQCGREPCPRSAIARLSSSTPQRARRSTHCTRATGRTSDRRSHSPGTSRTRLGATPSSGPGARVPASNCSRLPGVAGGAALPLVDGRVIVVDESDTVTVTDPRPRGEAAEVRTCSGFIPAGQLQVVGTMAVMGAACDAGDSLLYGIDLSAPKVAWTGSDLTGQHFALSADGTRVARQTLGTLGIEVDDAATGRRLRMLDGTCTFDDVPDPLRDRSPGCRPFPTAPVPVLAAGPAFLAGRVRRGGHRQAGVSRRVGCRVGSDLGHHPALWKRRRPLVHARRTRDHSRDRRRRYALVLDGVMAG